MFKLFKRESNEVSSGIAEGLTLAQVLAAMIQLLAEESVNHYRMGQFYLYVVKNKLAEAAGFKDAQDYFSKNLKNVSQTALTLYGAVVEGFSEENASRFGVTCLYLLLTYKEVADIKVNHEEPGPTPIEVPDAKGVVSTKAFSECSVEEMRRAIKGKRKPTSSKPLPAEKLVVAGQVEQEVLRRFAKGAKVRVGVRNEQGSAVLDFRGIPLDERQKLGEALLAPLPDAPAEQKVKVPPKA